MISIPAGGPYAADPPATDPSPPPLWRMLPRRTLTLCRVELQKLRHDRAELYIRAIQPALWLVIFGEAFTRLRDIPTGAVSYLAYLTPGILAQSALFIAIFYGIQIIWERDAGVLAKLLVTPTPRTALVAGKAFAAGIRALTQVVVVLILAAGLGVELTTTRSGSWVPPSSSCSAPASSPACRSSSPASSSPGNG